MRLKSRAAHPPGGFRYTIAQTNWSISPWISFDAAVQQIIAHRRANPYQAQVNGWSLDPQTVADELDFFNAEVCRQMGWTQYIGEGGDDFPKAQSPQSFSNLVGRVAAGAKTIKEWDIEGTVVSRELAEKRAQVCNTCPQNTIGDLTTWFTGPAAALIKNRLEKRNEMKLTTTLDPLLGVCAACSCPIKLKLWCPLDIIEKTMRSEDKQQLDPNCWILKEEITK